MINKNKPVEKKKVPAGNSIDPLNNTNEFSERGGGIDDPEKGRKRRGKKGKQRDQDAHMTVATHLAVPDQHDYDVRSNRSQKSNRSVTPRKRSFYNEDDDGFG